MNSHFNHLARLSRDSLFATLPILAFFLGLICQSGASQPQEEMPLEETTPSSLDVMIEPETASDAQRIAELQESLEQDKQQLLKLDHELDSPNSEYAIAEREFRDLLTELEKTQESLKVAKQSQNSPEILRLEQEIASLERQKKLAQDRFDLAIEDRKTNRDQRAILRSKIEKDQAALDSLSGAFDEPEASEESPVKLDPEGSKPSSADSEGKRDQANSAPSDSNEKEQESTVSEELTSEEQEDEELAQAAAEADHKEEEAAEAQEETKSIAARLADIQKLVAQEQKELDLARKKVDLATAAQLGLSQELATRQSENADAQDLNDLRSAISQASQRLIQARTEVSEISERLNDRRAEQSSLQSEHIVALHEMERKRQEAIAADEHVDSLRNPFSLKNILQWIIEHGPRLLMIAVGMFLLNRMASFFAYRSVRLVTSSSGRGSKVERENRAKTLVGVFQNAATVAIFVSGTLMMLEEAGANITVLMGGVAVIGLAVAFGAQNLIKDYFYGFVMLLENQYMLNDSVRIGGVSGQVERITLRMTVLRDANGVVHFIPNGTINSVSNETHGWSRAVCDITVNRREDLESIMHTLRQVSRELKAAPEFGTLMIDDPSEPAIETLNESTVLIKMSVKTLPNRHGAIKQEWLRRIKNKLDEQSMEESSQLRMAHPKKLAG
jgi:small-conductance mechanosensitive channel